MPLKATFRINEALWSLLYIALTLLLFRFVLIFTHAPLGSGLVQFMYILSDPLVYIFTFIPTISIGYYSVDLSVIVAGLSYYVGVRIVSWILFRVRPI